MSISENILNNLGGYDSNSLSHVFEHPDLLSDEEPQILDNSPYVCDESLIQILNEKKDV